MSKPVYYLAGRGGKLTDGLGRGLLQRGCSLTGRELQGDFARLSFQGQVDLIAEDLKGYWTEDTRIIAVSYGAYLLLHALADHKPWLVQRRLSLGMSVGVSISGLRRMFMLVS